MAPTSSDEETPITAARQEGALKDGIEDSKAAILAAEEEIRQATLKLAAELEALRRVRDAKEAQDRRVIKLARHVAGIDLPLLERQEETTWTMVGEVFRQEDGRVELRLTRDTDRTEVVQGMAP